MVKGKWRCKALTLDYEEALKFKTSVSPSLVPKDKYRLPKGRLTFTMHHFPKGELEVGNTRVVPHYINNARRIENSILLVMQHIESTNTYKLLPEVKSMVLSSSKALKRPDKKDIKMTKSLWYLYRRLRKKSVRESIRLMGL